MMNERSCKNCAYCNMRQFNRGRWYCSSPEVSVFALPVHESLPCFKPRTMWALVEVAEESIWLNNSLMRIGGI